ncbi:hypothetical protein AAVH_20438 [Aphelenchoides avenae]|nr:hypothetical protein AAVH_20438 [Aphelenchus avenae]
MILQLPLCAEQKLLAIMMLKNKPSATGEFVLSRNTLLMLVNFADLSAAQKLTIGLVIMDEKFALDIVRRRDDTNVPASTKLTRAPSASSSAQPDIARSTAPRPRRNRRTVPVALPDFGGESILSCRRKAMKSTSTPPCDDDDVDTETSAKS